MLFRIPSRLIRFREGFLLLLPTTSAASSGWATSSARGSSPFERSRDPQLSIRGPGLGKIPRGEIIDIADEGPEADSKEGLHD